MDPRTQVLLEALTSYVEARVEPHRFVRDRYPIATPDYRAAKAREVERMRMLALEILRECRLRRVQQTFFDPRQLQMQPRLTFTQHNEG